jgi:ATP-dependent DNA helicase RecG
LRRLRANIQQQNAPELFAENDLSQKLIQSLPFNLTKAQLRVTAEIKQDLIQIKPMLRLVQGDVGSGKTIVAVLALLQAVANGFQAALMAPTEILAEQHYQNLLQWLTPLNISVVWLSGKQKGKIRENALQEIVNGTANIIVGTHALFQESVQFAKLGLIVIDEQHRFGVHQRLALRAKGNQNDLVPHQLIMTATPIPRTLAMTVYADLDISVIDELPPGRTPIKTLIISNQRRNDILQRVRAVCLDNKQVYWVCTLIEESEVLQCQAAEVTHAQLQQELNELTIGLIHGRMKAQEKEQIMSSFKDGKINVLVATTVIEVGVDVPNAILMVIENAERLGLAQLHQLRGRVGRGSIESYCVLFYQSPLSLHARSRLAVMRDTNDGFEIAKKDLEIRGPGEVLGTRQTGLLQLRIANIVRDNYLLPEIQQAGEIIMRDYPEIVAPLIRRWLGQCDQYGQV